LCPALALYRERHPHAAPDAQGREPLLRAAPAHLVQERNEHAAAGRPDWVAERDGAAVDVDLARVPAHLLVHGARLRRESLVDFHQIQVGRLPARLLEAALRRRPIFNFSSNRWLV